jgi:uncharacterized protein YqeY
MREALLVAMKSRDRLAISALRPTLAAIDNAEAVEVGHIADRPQAIELIPVGLGTAEAPRRTLTEEDIIQIVRAEVASRDAAARDYDAAGRPERAEHLRDEAQILLSYLAEHSV